MLRNSPETIAKLAQLPVGYPIDERGIFSSSDQHLEKNGQGNDSPQYLLYGNTALCLAPESEFSSGDVLFP